MRQPAFSAPDAAPQGFSHGLPADGRQKTSPGLAAGPEAGRCAGAHKRRIIGRRSAQGERDGARESPGAAPDAGGPVQKHGPGDPGEGLSQAEALPGQPSRRRPVLPSAGDEAGPAEFRQAGICRPGGGLLRPPDAQAAPRAGRQPGLPHPAGQQLPRSGAVPPGPLSTGICRERPGKNLCAASCIAEGGADCVRKAEKAGGRIRASEGCRFRSGKRARRGTEALPLPAPFSPTGSAGLPLRSGRLFRARRRFGRLLWRL